MITERMLDECLGCEGWRQKAEFFASERLGRDLFVAAWTGVLLTSSTSAAGANSLSGQTRVSRTITEQSTSGRSANHAFRGRNSRFIWNPRKPLWSLKLAKM